MTAGASARSRFGPVLLTVVLAVGGCAWDAPQSSLLPRSDFGHEIVHLYTIVTVATAIIAVVVFALLGWVLLKYRDRPGAPPAAQIRGHSLLEIAWTIAPAIVLLIIAIPTIQVIFRTQGRAAPGALTVEVRAWQWWWEFRYPELGVVTANELHVPVRRPVVLHLEGPDVIHSFWIPPLGGKRDVVPGRHNQITFTMDTAGEYLGQCAEFCGASHANMRMRMVVERPEDFERWVAEQKAPPAEVAGTPAEGKAVYARLACVGCHTIRGVSAGLIGPDLTHLAARRTIAAGLLPNTLENVTAWVRDPNAIKPGVKMPNLGLTEAEARAVSIYLLSLK